MNSQQKKEIEWMCMRTHFFLKDGVKYDDTKFREQAVQLLTDWSDRMTEISRADLDRLQSSLYGIKK